MRMRHITSVIGILFLFLSEMASAQVFPAMIATEWKGKTPWADKVTVKFDKMSSVPGKVGLMHNSSIVVTGPAGTFICKYVLTHWQKTTVGYDFQYRYSHVKNGVGTGTLRMKITGTTPKNARMTITGQKPAKGKYYATLSGATLNPVIEERLKTIAVYEVRARKIFPFVDNILYVEDTNDNPLVLISGENGKAIDWIKGIAKVYENARPILTNVWAFNNWIVLQANQNWLLWDGKTPVEDCRALESWDEIKGGNDRYVFVVNKEAGYELWDMDNLQCLYRWGRNGNMPDYVSSIPLTITSDLRVWYDKSSDVNYGPVYLNPQEGRFYNYPLSNEDYIKKNDIKHINKIRFYGDYIYVACARRIYRMNMMSPGKWEEFLRIPIDVNNSVDDFCMTPNGNVLVIGPRVELYRSGAFDTPQVLGYNEKLETGLSDYSHKTIWLNLSKIQSDSKGNFVIKENNCIYIYNPDGIVGYTETYGKVTKFN